MLLAGSRVTRGPGWIGGEEDGGEGHLGTVTGPAGACADPDKQVEVNWDNGRTSVCNIGGVEPELLLYDNGPSGKSPFRDIQHYLL